MTDVAALGDLAVSALRRQPALGRKALNVGDRAELPGTVILGGLQQQLRYASSWLSRSLIAARGVIGSP